MKNPLPKDSKIILKEKDDSVEIILPFHENSQFDYLIRAFYVAISFMLIIFMTFTIKLKIQNSFSNLFWFVIFLLGGGIGLWQLYIIFRKKSNEILILTQEKLIHKSGSSPLYGNERKDILTHYNYLKNIQQSYTKDDIKSLLLETTKDNEIYLVRFKDKPFYLGYRLTNAEQKWLYEYILNFYKIESLYKVELMDESRPMRQKKRVLYTIVIIFIFLNIIGTLIKS